jgi:putative addiction module component (TIGR02574 family)
MSLKEILESSVEVRLKAIEEIWKSLSNEPEKIPLTEAQRQELDRRIEDHERNPNDTIAWVEAKARILNRK